VKKDETVSPVGARPFWPLSKMLRQTFQKWGLTKGGLFLFYPFFILLAYIELFVVYRPFIFLASDYVLSFCFSSSHLYAF
jgi:hypothetical protein